MKSRNVLILGRQDHHELLHALADMGYAPRVRGSILLCMEKLRSESTAAIVVERDFTHADVLEFVLNVNDLDKRVPVIVLGQPAADRLEQKIAAQKQAVLLNLSLPDQRRPERLKVALQSVLDAHAATERDHLSGGFHEYSI